ncbi:MAG: hypothetical protein V3U39_12210 [Acidimicrobiia bacterium]
MIEGNIGTAALPLEERTPQPCVNTVMINERVSIHDDPATGWRRVVVGGVPFLSFHEGDKHSVRFVCVQLRLKGLAQQLELSRAFGHDRVTQHRWEKRFEVDGLEGLTPYRPKGRPVSIPASIEKAIVSLHGQGHGIRRIAGKLGLTHNVVRGVYERFGLEPHTMAKQVDLPEPPCELDEVETSPDDAGEAPETIEEEDDVDADWDGLLQPEYSTEQGVGFAGVMLALPVLASHRVISVFKDVYRNLSLIPVYGLETMVALLIFMALWRIKRVEQLKAYPPLELGKALGLPRVPEMKTVRRKLGLLAGRGKARETMLKLAEVRVQQEEDLLGYLYVDGHVRAYSGKHDLAKGFSTARHMPVRATTDTWANDRHGDPVFVVTSEMNEGLTKMLRPVLRQARELAGGESMTVIFDRGGWSPQLFVELIEEGYHLITYRKGRSPDLAEEAFETRVLEVDGREVRYRLCDEAQVRVGQARLEWSDGSRRPLLMRQVTRLTDTGHQTQVLTSRADLEAEQVLWQMFARWRQENFFKYMRQEFAIDGLVEYGATGVDPKLERRNPERLALEAEIKAMKKTVERLQGQRCELIGSPAAAVDAPAGFERFVPDSHKERALHQEIQDLKLRLQELEAFRDDLPERVGAGDLERLRPERKLLMDTIKTAAYRIETELVRALAPHYSRSDDEGRKLVAAALSSTADIEVTATELRVTLAPQSSPHRSRAVDALCADLNKRGTVVPGTGLRLVLACRQNPEPDVA